MFGWLSKKAKPQQPPDEVRLAAALEVLDRFGALLEGDENGFAFKDEQLLPARKEIILECICFVLGKSPSFEHASALHACAMSLSFYQKGIGKYLLHVGGIDFSKFPPGSVAPDQLAHLITANPAGKERFDRYERLRKVEYERIKARLASVSTGPSPE